VVLDTPRGDLVEISSSSYGLSLFSSKVGSHHNEGAGATLGGSTSVSIGELWPDIDRLNEASHEGTSTFITWSPRMGPSSHPCVDFRG
jgi:hypothetical protein